MNLQPGDQDEPEVNLTPLIDVVFLLLVFFMLAAQFGRETALDLATGLTFHLV